MEPAKLPRVDDRLVEPETATEMIDGRVMQVLPAEPPHARRQCGIAMVIEADTAPGYAAATELLTRVDHGSDFAADACIYKEGVDPATGGRYLEEMAFEVKYTQSEADITARARKLAQRGVRRVFAIYVQKDGPDGVQAGPVKEWQADRNVWRELLPDEEIVDRCLARPIKVRALLDTAQARKQVAEVLVAQKHEVIESYKDKALKEQGKKHVRQIAAQKKALAKALAEEHVRQIEAQKKALAEEHARQIAARDEAQVREAILELCEVLAITVTTEQRARLDAMTVDELGQLRRAIRTGRSWPRNV